jgi:ankyrin repeat protein/beta-lactamase regulating signal transducer with metallopeptidase domain
MESWLSRITDYLLAQSWQIAVLTVVVAIVSFLLRNRSAHVRYLIWLLVLAKCLVPPLHSVPLAVLPPEQPIAFVESSPMAGRAYDTTRIERDIVTEPAKSTPIQAPMELPPKTTNRPSTYNIRVWLALGWLVGAVALLFYNLLNALRTQIWLWRQRKALPVKFRHNVESFFSAHGVKHIPNVWLINGMNQPFVWGLVRGSIYLPADLLNLQDSKSWASLLGHELSHVIRFDAIVHTLQIFAQVVFWFHPFVWWANRKIRAEREKCCDEMAIVSLHALPEDYSEAIVEALAVKYESIRPVPSLAVAGPVKNIEERIKTMLRPGKKFYKHPSLVAATVVLLLTLLTAPTALVLTARAGTKATTMPLHQAAADGDIDKVKSLISKGVDVNTKDEKGWTPLHTASYYGRKDIAVFLIAKGGNINDKDISGRTPLHVASDGVRTFVFESLVAKGANVDARDKAGNTPLHYAAGWHLVNTRILKLIIDKGADINSRNEKGETPLHFAARSRKKHDTVVEFLLDNGADINAKDKSGSTPLHWAAVYGRNEKRRKERVELLLNKGAVIEQKNDKGITPFHRATMAGNKKVMELLLNRGADINSIQWNGWSALHYAARAGKNDIVKLLIDKGAEVNAKNVRGETPAHFAAVQNHKDTVKLLTSRGADVSTIQLASYIGDLTKVNSFIEKGISINVQDGYWLTPLHAAAGAGQREVSEFLISKGALVNADAVSEGPGTPLHYATDGGSKEVTKLLISKGALINARNKNGETPLHLASKKGYSDLAKLIVANKADVNAKTINDWTPLHFATKNGHKDIAALLIENGANINVESKEPKGTPLLYAARSGHKDVINLLIDKGADVSPVDDLLYYMCEYGHKDLVGYFIQNGANVNSEVRLDAPSLYILWDFKGLYKWDKVKKIADSNQADILRLLLDHGANPNAKDRWDWSLLHYAAETEGYIDMTRMLLDKGSNPNAKEGIGQTPLHLAAEPGHKAMVELLISRGADVNVKDFYGRTPLWYAEDLGSNAVYGYRDTPPTPAVKLAKKEVAELLRKHGAKE